MAIAAGAVWEVRAAGLGASDANGGFYVSGGVDYSQQDAAQLAVSDAVTNGTTTVTSATGGFTSAMVGNGINIAGVCYQIAACTNTNTVTVDRIITTATGLAARVGGAMASPGKAAGQMVGSNTMWLQNGSYTVSSATANVSNGIVSVPGGADGNRPSVIRGYQTTRYDTGTKPEIYCPSSLLSSAAAIVTLNNHTIAINIRVRSTASAPSVHCWNINASQAVACEASNCNYHGFTGTGACIDCYANNTGRAGADGFAVGTCISCVSVGALWNNFSSTQTVNCIAIGGGVGFNVNNYGAIYTRCTAYGTSSHGFWQGSPGWGLYAFTDCIAVNCGGYGFSNPKYAILTNCAGYGNTSGNLPASSSGEFQRGSVYIGSDVSPVTVATLTSNPFVNASGNNFTLNTSAGGGASLRSILRLFAVINLSSYNDIGAVQHQDAGGGIIPVGMNGGIRG